MIDLLFSTEEINKPKGGERIINVNTLHIRYFLFVPLNSPMQLESVSHCTDILYVYLLFLNYGMTYFAVCLHLFLTSS